VWNNPQRRYLLETADCPISENEPKCLDQHIEVSLWWWTRDISSKLRFLQEPHSHTFIILRSVCLCIRIPSA
jgi:hypothetical protein